jgi:hypothetical protein
MYRPAPRHPLASFRFWFLVVGCAAAATAWRMGWLPQGGSSPETAEVQLPAAPAGDSATEASPATDPRVAALEQSLAAAQQEPAATPLAAASDAAATTDPFAGLTPAVAPTTAGGSPFGPANPEFVPADTFARKPGAAETAGPTAQRFPGDPGMITQVSATEAAEPPVTAAAVLTGDAPTDFPDQPAAVPQIDWASIDKMINEGQDVEAHRILSTLYWEQPDQREKIRDRVEQTAMRIYFQPQPH